MAFATKNTKLTKILKKSVHRDLAFVVAKASVIFVAFVAKTFVFFVAKPFVFFVATVVSLPQAKT